MSSATVAGTSNVENQENEFKNNKKLFESPYDLHEEDITTINDVTSMKISRGDRPEADINWTKLETLFVYDEVGNKIKFTDIYRVHKTIILFVRHFLDFITKEYVEDIAIIPHDYLQDANVRLVVIGPAPYKHIKSFKTLTKLNYTLYVDPEREVYKAVGCSDKLVHGSLTASKHIKSGFITGVAGSVWRAMTAPVKELQGDVTQQGGCFIMGPGDVCHFSHIDQSSTDHCTLNDVLAKAGVRNISFPKDPRVLII